jgi:hypothetical protein
MTRFRSARVWEENGESRSVSADKDLPDKHPIINSVSDRDARGDAIWKRAPPAGRSWQVVADDELCWAMMRWPQSYYCRVR